MDDRNEWLRWKEYKFMDETKGRKVGPLQKKRKGCKISGTNYNGKCTNWEELKKYNHKNSHTDTIVVLALFQSPQH